MPKTSELLAANIKRFREQLQLTQDDLVKRSKTSRKIVVTAEAGKRLPDPENITKLAMGLGIQNEADLFRDSSGIQEPSLHEAMGVLLKALESKIGHYAPIAPSKQKASNSGLPLDEEKLLEKIRKLTPAQKQSLDRMADQLLSKNAKKGGQGSEETAS